MLEDIAGTQAVGPLLFFPAMIIVSPLSLIPTLPTLVAVTVILIAGQFALGRQTLWLPARLRGAELSPQRAIKALVFLKKAAQVLDAISKPRLQWLVRGPGMRLSCVVCILVALTMPPLEFVPGASTTAGSIISVFGLSMTTQDGLLMILALTATLGIPVALLLYLLCGS